MYGKLLKTERLTAVIAAKGASTKYWLSCVNSLFYAFNLQTFLKLYFGVLCVDGWGNNIDTYTNTVNEFLSGSA